ncbi:PREDICTED: protein NBR1 homolog [Lupinus angustifolius]|uniref:protein NBR1 homolog n=1 Tax=Lupinus angustifolius TaxID=3871 RepID=UPI00092E9E4C|nr:PREDICTED: protein NBR1 homolog [Lupinus angustifolius]
MGVKQIDLNNEILRLNEYNMEQSLDNPSSVSERDHILKELHEMGFHNNEMNKKLHIKNKGNINLIIWDLLNGEQA